MNANRRPLSWGGRGVQPLHHLNKPTASLVLCYERGLEKEPSDLAHIPRFCSLPASALVRGILNRKLVGVGETCGFKMTGVEEMKLVVRWVGS